MTIANHTAIGAPASVAVMSGETRSQWVHLSALGRLKTKDGRGPFTVNDPEAVIAMSFALANTDKLPIDYNHAIDLAAPKGGQSPAAGWISRMETREDGIWGLVEWTPQAAEAIHSKEYRFISPVLQYAPGGKVRAILRASLTNDPNLTLTALNAAQGKPTMDTEEFMSKLRELLGLGEEADSAAVFAAISKLSESRNSADPARFVPMDVFQKTVAELNQVKSGVSLMQAEKIVDMALEEARIAPFMRDWAINLCTMNAAAFHDFLEGAGKPIHDFAKRLTTPGDFSMAKMNAIKKGRTNALSEADQRLGLTDDDLTKYRASEED